MLQVAEVSSDSSDPGRNTISSYRLLLALLFKVGMAIVFLKNVDLRVLLMDQKERSYKASNIHLSLVKIGSDYHCVPIYAILLFLPTAKIIFFRAFHLYFLHLVDPLMELLLSARKSRLI